MSSVSSDRVCSICCEKETKSLRKIITCNYCKNTTCKKCTCRYLLETKETPHCMHCRKEWNPDFIYTIGTKNFFHKQLPENLAKNFLEKEKMKLPETQPIAEHTLKVRKLKKEIKNLHNKYYELYFQAKPILNTISNSTSKIYNLKKKIVAIDNAKLICKNKKCLYLKNKTENCPVCGCGFYSLDDYDKYDIKNKLKEQQQKEIEFQNTQIQIKEYVDYMALTQELSQKRRSLYLLEWDNKTIVKKKFIKACPNENCNGFLSTQWKCGICEKSFCKDCHEEKLENHICNEDTKKTIALLKKDTRPCPKCGTGIFKIDGCSQMWCVDCKTAFDWNTGEICQGVIHNPHYFQWLNESGGWQHEHNPEVNLCDGIVTIAALRTNIPNISHWKSNDKTRVLYQYIRVRDHLRHVIPGYQNTEEAYVNLRVKYLINDITEEEWLQKIKMYLKKHEYNSQIQQIFQMHSTTINELLLELIQHKDCKKSMKQLKQLTEYTIKHLDNIANIYKRKSLSYEIML